MDFLPLAFAAFAVVFVLLAAVLLSLRGKAFLVVFSVLTWLAVMAFLQGSFLNFGIDSLAADGLAEPPPVWSAVLNLAIWLILGVGIVLAALKIKDKPLFFMISVVLLVMVLFVQGLNLGIAALSAGGEDAPRETVEAGGDASLEERPPRQKKAILTEEGMFLVAPKGNAIVIVLDRFDVYYYNKLIEADPDFFTPLDGFTYYDNNISLYSRTYPSITYMLTGAEQDFEMTAEEYFEKAYGESLFFEDLKENGYGIRLYTESYYAYRDAGVLENIAENATKDWAYRVNDSFGLTGSMLAVSAYRYVPTLFKPYISVSTGDFSRFLEMPVYVTDDAATYAAFREQGVTVRNDADKQFTFIHLNGCHNPFKIDENGNRVEDGEALPAIRGVFKMIFEYFDALKQAGLYEDATIIITGDHARAISDREDVKAPRVTALFVKPSGQADTALTYSSAPVCQENLRAEIIKSEGILTETDYGNAFSDIEENADVVRKYCFEKTLEDGTHQIVEYRVTGDANVFSNWEIVDRRNIGKLYK